MGEVYVARDERLNRNVALKIITSGSSDDVARQRRFTVEARAASSLNHPNIITVHDFGSADGISYIVSELVDGESLRHLIKRGPLPIRKLLEIGVQIADGLEAAHQNGIVHRDLKPENIMITRAGRVKILDFGLAKPIMGTSDVNAVEEATFDGLGTQPGLIVGTVGYMSPEQARGEAVSFQSDQFSLGLLLHEMASGHPAFRRETPMATLLAIANVDRLPFTPGPATLRLLVERLLSKDPARRFVSTAEIHERLRKILEKLPSKQGEGLPPLESAVIEAVPAATEREEASVPNANRRIVTSAVLGVVLAFGLGLVVAHFLLRSPELDLSQLKMVRLDSAPEAEVLPALSSTGENVAFAKSVNGIFQIFVRPRHSSTDTQVTKATEDCMFPFWAPDDRRVFYISGSTLWSESTYGGTPTRVADQVISADVSPDGKTFVLGRRDGLFLMDAGGKPRRLDRAPQIHGVTQVKFSPDGSQLAAGSTSQLVVMSLPDGSQRLSFSLPLQGFAWMADGQRIVCGDEHMSVVNLRTAKVTQLTAGTGRENWPTLSPKGEHVVFSSAVGSYGLTAVPLGESSSPISLPVDGGSAVWAPVRNEFAYVRSNEIWLRDSHSGWERQIVSSTGATPSGLAYSPDGEHIAYSSGDSIWIAGLSGGTPARLISAPDRGLQTSPAWSPDGSTIAYATRTAIMKVQVGGGGPPVLLKDNVAGFLSWSPDGRWIAVATLAGLTLISPDGKQSRSLATGMWFAPAWTKDGTRLLGLRKSDDRRLVVASFDPSESTGEKTLADLGAWAPAFSFGMSTGPLPVVNASLSPDGKFLIASVLRLQSNLWTSEGLARYAAAVRK